MQTEPLKFTIVLENQQSHPHSFRLFILLILSTHSTRHASSAETYPPAVLLTFYIRRLQGSAGHGLRWMGCRKRRLFFSASSLEWFAAGLRRSLCAAGLPLIHRRHFLVYTT